MRVAGLNLGGSRNSVSASLFVVLRGAALGLSGDACYSWGLEQSNKVRRGRSVDPEEMWAGRERRMQLLFCCSTRDKTGGLSLGEQTKEVCGQSTWLLVSSMLGANAKGMVLNVAEAHGNHKFK